MYRLHFNQILILYLKIFGIVYFRRRNPGLLYAWILVTLLCDGSGHQTLASSSWNLKHCFILIWFCSHINSFPPTFVCLVMWLFLFFRCRFLKSHSYIFKTRFYPICMTWSKIWISRSIFILEMWLTTYFSPNTLDKRTL